MNIWSVRNVQRYCISINPYLSAYRKFYSMLHLGYYDFNLLYWGRPNWQLPAEKIEFQNLAKSKQKILGPVDFNLLFILISKNVLLFQQCFEKTYS